MICIITGDIINSRLVKNQSQWLTPLKNALSFLTKTNGEFEIYRGDSFQLKTKSITHSFEYAMYIKACVKAASNCNVRLGIGIGSVDFKGVTISESNGSAFQNSGLVLDAVKQQHITLGIKADEVAVENSVYNFNEIFETYFKFASILMDSWTSNSAEAVKYLIETNYANQQYIANKIGIKQNAVSKRLKRANIDALLELNTLYKKHVTQL